MSKANVQSALKLSVLLWIAAVAWLVLSGFQLVPIIALVCLAMAMIYGYGVLSKLEAESFEQQRIDLGIERCAKFPDELKERIEGFETYKSELSDFDFNATYRAETDDISIVFSQLDIRQPKKQRRRNPAAISNFAIAVLTITDADAPSLLLFPRRTPNQWLENVLSELLNCRWQGLRHKLKRLGELMFGGLPTPNNPTFSRKHCILGDDITAIQTYLKPSRLRSLLGTTPRRMELRGNTVLMMFDYTRIRKNDLKDLFAEAFTIAKILASDSSIS